MKRYYSCKPIKRPNGHGGFVIEPEILHAITRPPSGTPGNGTLSASDDEQNPTVLVFAVSDRERRHAERDGTLHGRLAAIPGVIDHGADFAKAVESVRTHHGAVADLMKEQVAGGE